MKPDLSLPAGERNATNAPGPARGVGGGSRTACQRPVGRRAPRSMSPRTGYRDFRRPQAIRPGHDGRNGNPASSRSGAGRRRPVPGSRLPCSRRHRPDEQHARLPNPTAMRPRTSGIADRPGFEDRLTARTATFLLVRGRRIPGTRPAVRNFLLPRAQGDGIGRIVTKRGNAPGWNAAIRRHGGQRQTEPATGSDRRAPAMPHPGQGLQSTAPLSPRDSRRVSSATQISALSTSKAPARLAGRVANAFGTR